MTITTVELLACPFCDSSEVFMTNEEGIALVMCRSCGAEGPGVATGIFPIDEEAGAAEAWNTRTEPTLISNLVKALEDTRGALGRLLEVIADIEQDGFRMSPEQLAEVRECEAALRSNLDKEEGDNG